MGAKPKLNKSSINGIVYFKFQDQLEKYYLSLKGSDLYCYDYETKKKIKFMHSLIGCFLISQTNNSDDPLNLEFNEAVNGIAYRRIEVKLSQLFKRVFYVTTESECERWITQLTKAIGNSKMRDSYTKSELLG